MEFHIKKEGYDPRNGPPDREARLKFEDICFGDGPEGGGSSIWFPDPRLRSYEPLKVNEYYQIEEDGEGFLVRYKPTGASLSFDKDSYDQAEEYWRLMTKKAEEREERERNGD